MVRCFHIPQSHDGGGHQCLNPSRPEVFTNKISSRWLYHTPTDSSNLILTLKRADRIANLDGPGVGFTSKFGSFLLNLLWIWSRKRNKQFLTSL